ncbi:hypothetical protein CAQUA_10805 [Corynebacterium aquatimens]|nr:hypothetical protein CAQUA_10805 [Corynebacterium aquatimens]
MLGSVALHAPLIAAEVLTDLTPGLRLAGVRRLPSNMAAGIVGAEAAAWSAVSPSLLPHPWWVTAANVGICQTAGHTVGTTVANVVDAVQGQLGVRPPSKWRHRLYMGTQITMSLATVGAYVSAARRRPEQAQLIDDSERASGLTYLGGIAAGSMGYGALLLIGEGIQIFADTFNKELRRWMPSYASWPLVVAGLGALGFLLGDKVVVRRILTNAYKNAEELNKEFLPGAPRPVEPQRSGSHASLERWRFLGRQGRAVVAGGPRARDIAAVMGPAPSPGGAAGASSAPSLFDGAAIKEPIRVFIGLKDRTPEEQAEKVLRELDRTDAWSRKAIAVLSSAGTGWISDYHTSGLEFLLRGDTAIAAMQYSFMPSAFSYASDREAPTRSASVLLAAIQERLDAMPADKRPRLYVGGESLGAYGISDSFDSPKAMLERIDGAVFTGTPGFTQAHSILTQSRDKGSPERVPVVDGGRHVRFAAHEDHLRHTFDGSDYANDWEFPRVVFAQHASDPVVWWDWPLLFRRPDWLREPGSRRVPAPDAQHLDVLHSMYWMPFVTWWQVGVDQLSSLEPEGGHGHQYWRETVAYWNAVLDAGATEEQIDAIYEWIHADSTKIRATNITDPSR